MLLPHVYHTGDVPKRMYSARLASSCRYWFPLRMASRRVPHVLGLPLLPFPSNQARRTWQTFAFASQGLISSKLNMLWGISKGFRKSTHVCMCSWSLGICWTMTLSNSVAVSLLLQTALKEWIKHFRVVTVNHSIYYCSIYWYNLHAFARTFLSRLHSSRVFIKLFFLYVTK